MTHFPTLVEVVQFCTDPISNFQLLYKKVPIKCVVVEILSLLHTFKHSTKSINLPFDLHCFWNVAERSVGPMSSASFFSHDYRV